MDPEHCAQIYALWKQLCEEGIGLTMTRDDLDTAERLRDRHLCLPDARLAPVARPWKASHRHGCAPCHGIAATAPTIRHAQVPMLGCAARGGTDRTHVLRRRLPRFKDLGRPRCSPTTPT